MPLKMAFQNTVGKGENASNNFLQCFFFFTFPSFILYVICKYFQTERVKDVIVW